MGLESHANNADPLQVSRSLGFASRKLREQQCVAAQRVHVVGIGSKGALIVVLRCRNVALNLSCQRCSCREFETQEEKKRRKERQGGKMRRRQAKDLDTAKQVAVGTEGVSVCRVKRQHGFKHVFS